MKKQSSWNIIIFFIKTVWYYGSAYCLLALPQIIISSLQPFIMVFFPKQLIDGLIENKDLKEILWTAGLMILSLLIVRILNPLLQYFNTKAYNDLTFRIKAEMGTKAMSLEYKELENNETLDLINRVQETFQVDIMFEALIGIVSNLITLLGLIVLIAQLNIFIVIAIIIVVLVNVFCNRASKKYEYQWQKDAAPYQRRFSYILSLMYNFVFGKEIRVNRLQEEIKDKYNREVEIYSINLNKIILKFLNLNVLRNLVSVLQDLFLYLYLIISAKAKRITIGDFTMFVNAANSLTNALVGITSSFIELEQQVRYVKDFKRFMEMEKKQSKETAHPKYDYTKGITFDDVSFRYPGSKKNALKHISIEIKPGEKLSVVGLNGAGKTTFVKLLTKLYCTEKGRIELHGVDVNEIDDEEYMKNFSIVFQDFQLFAFSLKENIILNNGYDRKRIYDTIQKTGLNQKVDSLPKKLETQIFKIFDPDGVELSGGESQKVALARSYYKDADIIILDEPTSALDPLAEYEIYRQFDELVQNKTAIYISHRLSSCRFCDKIAVFQEGCIVQYGTHDGLLTEDGLYRDMFTKQSGFYTDMADTIQESV